MEETPPGLNLREMGLRIAGRRVRLDMTQADLAGRSKVSKPTISMLEKGQIPRVSAQALVKIAWALGVNLEYLISGKDGPREGIPADVDEVGPTGGNVGQDPI